MPVNDFAVKARVYYEDTDAGGVVYYANYLRFMERARTEWLRTIGHSQQQIAADLGLVFAVAEVKVTYRKPARLDDELLISCVPVPEGRVSLRFKQTITRLDRAAQVLAEGEVMVVCVDAKSFRPRGLPDFVRLADGK